MMVKKRRERIEHHTKSLAKASIVSRGEKRLKTNVKAKRWPTVRGKNELRALSLT
jgi:hypothetical protein